MPETDHDDAEAEQTLINRIGRSGAEIHVIVNWRNANSKLDARNDREAHATVPFGFRDMVGALQDCAKNVFGRRLHFNCPREEAPLVELMRAEGALIQIEIRRSRGNLDADLGWRPFETREDEASPVFAAAISGCAEADRRTLLLGLKAAAAEADAVRALEPVADQFIRHR